MTGFLLLLELALCVLRALASWSVTYPQSLRSVQGSCVVIPCAFDYPVNTPDSITSIWYKDNGGQRIPVFHSSTPDAVDAQFQSRAELLGDPLRERNCTLLLRNTQTRDSGKYIFRFELDEKNRWLDLQGVELTVTDTPDTPSITSPEELQEAQLATFDCSSPYACPYNHISLQWVGQSAEASRVSGTVQLDTGGVLQKQTLSTSLSWQDHHRKLSCEVAVGALAKANEVTLQVKHSPKGVEVSISPSTKNIRVGDAVSLTCNTASSYPGVTAYRWYKDGVACGVGQVKTIQSITREDYGQYHCEAENPIGTTVAETATLYVFSAILSVSPSSEVQEGGTVTLTCDVPGEDKQEIHYSWYKNNVWMKEGTARSLIFHEVSAGDTGYYLCKVQNDKGSEKSRVVGLNVVYPPRPPALALFQETQEGKLAIIHCTVDSNPQSTLSLFRGKQLLATTSSHSAPSQRVSVTATRNSLKLEIQKMVPEDGGEYQCVAANKYGNATTTRFFGAQTARVVISPFEEVPEGERVTLTCLATLEPEEGTTYTWYKNAKWLQEGRENSLIFPAIVSRDAGTFYCVAKNTKGTNTSPAITLHVLYPPRQPVVESFLETQEGHLGVIQCTVDSNPPSEIALHKGETLLGSTNASYSPADPRVSVTRSHNALKVSIKGVTLEDEGRLVCSAQNRYGDSSTSVDFTAETARIVLTPSPEVPEGQEVRLSCLVSSDASTSANYTWYRNGLCLPEALGDSLVFPQVARGDAGVYFCRVESHRVSKSSASITLSVLYPPEPPRVAVFVETEKGRAALFRCSVDSNPPAELSLYKGDHLIASTGTPSADLPRARVSATRNAMRVEMGDIVPEDEGSYRCVAANVYGSSVARLHFRVQTALVLVTPSPELLEGDAATLTCNVLGGAPDDDATFSWYKNSKRILNNNSSTLAFLQITSRDAGSYHCKAHTGEETSLSAASLPLSITVFYPPRKPQLTSFLQTQGGPVAVLQCTADSVPQSFLAVFKGDELLASSRDSKMAPGQRLRVSASYNSLKVEIRGVVMEDEGGYTCWASNLYGNSSVSIQFAAETARIWISPPDVLEGDSANLTCAVDSGAAGAPQYTWYKDHRWYAEGPSRALSLPKVTVADAGTYYCAVKTSERVRNSSLGTLNVLYPPRNVQVASFLEAQNGQLAILVCSVDSNPPSEVSLRQGDEVLASTGLSRGRGVLPDPRMQTASSPNSLRLEIKEVRLDDEGRYDCLASNGIGTAKASLDLAVETTKVVVIPSPEVHEGEPVSLTCEDIGSTPGALYTWYKNTQWLTEGTANSLIFQAVTPGDAGAYSCQVLNARGTRTSPPASVHVLYAPKEISLVSFLETQSGHQAIIQCAVESHPLSDIALYKGQEMVASSGTSGGLPAPRLNVHRAHNFLKVEIKGVQLEDEGQYLCLANNTYGAATASVYFSVESARITIEPSPDIQEGSAVNLTCVVASRAAGEMNYTWYRNSRWLQDGPGRSLLLESVARDDAGSYHCRAEGETGSVTSGLVLLNVLYAPRTPTLRAFLDNQSGRVGIIRCQADSHPPSELALYKGGCILAHTRGTRPAAAQRFRALQSHNSLRVEIRDLVAEDSGRYVCLASNPLGNGTAALDFSAETLSDLHFFKVLAGVFIGMVCTAALCALAFGVRTNWSRIHEQRKKWKVWRTPKAELVEMEKKEAGAQGLNEQDPGVPLCG